MPLRKPTKKSSNMASRLSKARLAAMIEEATVDAYGESEQITGWYTMIESTSHCRLTPHCSVSW